MKLKKIALIATYPWVGVSSPVLNTALFFVQKGFQVDIFTVESADYQDISNIGIENNLVTVHKTRVYKNIFFRFCSFVGILGIRFFRKLFGLFLTQETKKQHRIFRTDAKYYVDYFITNLSFFIQNIKPKKRYDLAIAFDSDALIKTNLLCKFWKIPFIFHSLEIPEKQELKKKHVRAANKAVLTLSQDKIRCDIVSEYYQIPRSKVHILYNSSIGSILPEKKDFFRKKFNISKEKRIVLLTGSLKKAHLADFFINSISSWDKKFVLVLHTWKLEGEIQNLMLKYKKKYPENIYYSDDVAKFEEKYLIFQSVDFGLIGFSTADVNLKYAIGSSGKFYDFMRVGVPIIAYKSEGAYELIEKKGVGKTVENSKNIGDILVEMNKKYTLFSNNCVQKYPQFEFSINFEPIINNILKCKN